MSDAKKQLKELQPMLEKAHAGTLEEGAKTFLIGALYGLSARLIEERDEAIARSETYRGLLHSEQIAEMHYCETCELAFQCGEGAPARCPHCRVRELQEKYEKTINDPKGSMQGT